MSRTLLIVDGQHYMGRRSLLCVHQWITKVLPTIHPVTQSFNSFEKPPKSTLNKEETKH